MPPANFSQQVKNQLLNNIVMKLGDRVISLVGLMGSGKSSVGKRLSNKLNIPFADSDKYIENLERMKIAKIFSEFGEEHFRIRERQIVTQLLKGGPKILATGGGAFMNPDTRMSIKKAGIVIWLKADLETLMKRVRHSPNRPLLKSSNTEKVLRNLISIRYPVYAEADIVVQTSQYPHGVIVRKILEALGSHLEVEHKNTENLR